MKETLGKSCHSYVSFFMVIWNYHCLTVITCAYVNNCYLPEFRSPLHGLQFKSAKGYPRRNISAEINLNEEIKREIKTMGRMRLHERKVMKIFPEEASFELANIPHSLSTCTIHRKYFKIEDILVDKHYGDCWVLWQWKGINITWTECNRYCTGVPAKPPFYVYLCLPGHVIDFKIWAFCPRHRRFIIRIIQLPQCCFCTKYQCLIQPRIIKIGTYRIIYEYKTMWGVRQ
ncbi:uncharacterized protein LOC127715926 [Mytilus californianus]|uniref:uncharacterized protein LOC127715926 n=1 Tax=Mytilus californianus TaxID=6549 RepID=UPI0022471A56|nr:uncharacterized protein LOC127715926 [Mytilus californianus]